MSRGTLDAGTRAVFPPCHRRCDRRRMAVAGGCGHRAAAGGRLRRRAAGRPPPHRHARLGQRLGARLSRRRVAQRGHRHPAGPRPHAAVPGAGQRRPAGRAGWRRGRAPNRRSGARGVRPHPGRVRRASTALDQDLPADPSAAIRPDRPVGSRRQRRVSRFARPRRGAGRRSRGGAGLLVEYASRLPRPRAGTKQDRWPATPCSTPKATRSPRRWRSAWSRSRTTRSCGRYGSPAVRWRWAFGPAARAASSSRCPGHRWCRAGRPPAGPGARGSIPSSTPAAARSSGVAGRASRWI